MTAGTGTRKPQLGFLLLEGSYLYERLTKLGVPFGAPYKNDYSSWGSILSSPYSRKLPCQG